MTKFTPGHPYLDRKIHASLDNSRLFTVAWLYMQEMM